MPLTIGGKAWYASPMFHDKPSIEEALARLDADIAAAEERLTDLRRMRASIEPFIEQYLSKEKDARSASPQMPSPRATPTGSPKSTSRPTLPVQLTSGSESETGGNTSSSFTESVIDVLRERPGVSLDIDEVYEIMRGRGSSAKRERVRNALSYGVRIEKLRRSSKRGHFTLVEGPSSETGGGHDDWTGGMQTHIRTALTGLDDRSEALP